MVLENLKEEIYGIASYMEKEESKEPELQEETIRIFGSLQS